MALDATNQLQGLRFDLSNPDTGYRSLQGGDAVKGIDGQALTGHGYRGSLASGVKGPHKGGGPFDPSNFDIDLFIVSNKMAGAVKSQSSFRNGGRIPEIAAVQRALEAELRKNPNVAGLRRGEREKLIFRYIQAKMLGISAKPVTSRLSF